MTYNINNNSVQLQLPAPELSAVMTGVQVTIGTLIANPCKIIFDNMGTVPIAITMSSLGVLQTWKTFPAGEALVLDNDLEAFPAGTIFYGTGASGSFSISYTYIKAY
jgi:ethanolamine utilization microcompartment shell protein EutS